MDSNGKSEERICVVIDGANLNCGFERHGRKHCFIDDDALIDGLSLGRNVVERIYVDSYSETYDERAMMMEEKRRNGFKVISRRCTGKQKGVDCDVNNAVVLGAIKDLYDTVVIVSGDGDMVSAAEFAHSVGKHVEFASFRDSYSGYLRPECDRFHNLSELRMVDATELRDMLGYNEPKYAHQTTLFDFEGKEEVMI